MNRVIQRRLPVVLLSLVVLLMAAAAVGMNTLSQAGAQTAPESPELSGQALASSLGLQPQPSFSGDCGYYVEVEESGAGYCLDAVGADKVERWKIGLRLQGESDPTSYEVDCYAKTQAVANMSVHDEGFDTAEAEAKTACQVAAGLISPEAGADASPTA
jgi:hypothetical protein